jgi:GT2 family glycosyltransferase
MDESARRAYAHRTLHELLGRVREMEASPFWRLRNRIARVLAGSGLRVRPIPPYVPPVDIESLFAPETGPPSFRHDSHLVAGLDRERMLATSSAFAHRPLISVVIPAYDTPERYLRPTLDSVFAQGYDNWELCVADDASGDPGVRAILGEYARRDPRVKLVFRPENGHISRATNSALALASGEFVAFMDHDDLLAPDALFEIAHLINRDPDVDVVYTDENKIDENSRFHEPHFKPDWAPESFLSRMYIGHLIVVRRSLVEAVGGLRPDFDGSQDYDLMLRVTERTDRIRHIPRILYHWRIHPDSTSLHGDVKPYAYDAAVRALNEALVRRGEDGRISAKPEYPGSYDVRFALREKKKVSVIVPTRDHGDDVNSCIGSLFAKTYYVNLEVVIVDNGSTDPASLAIFERLTKRDRRIRVLRYDAPFNFSKINNFAVEHTDGEYLLVLNNDTQAVSEEWIEALLEQAQRPAIGAVGAMLIYPDETVQHAGVIVGLGGVAAHSHKHYPQSAPGYFHVLQSVNNYSAVTGACMMVRRDVFLEVGGFDESLAIAYNDVDLCLKIRDAGYRNVYLPHVRLYHHESKSRHVHDVTPEGIARFDREMDIIRARWRPLAMRDPYYNPNLTLAREDYTPAP